jgi:TonB-dependent SusC/RagA subfamily outer membrane receptor
MEASIGSRTPRPDLSALLFVLTLLLSGCVASTRETRPPVDRPGGGNIITAEDIARYPATTAVEDILEQRFPGLRVRRRHEPGGAATVNVLGMGQPLYIVDGVPLRQMGGTLGLNPRDIETIEVWKYGGPTAEYGLRGANGVVIIHTKRGGTR